MGFISRSYECSNCGNVYRDLVEKDSDQTSECSECDTTNSYALSFPGIAKFSIMNKEQRKECLLKRSAEHTKKKIMS